MNQCIRHPTPPTGRPSVCLLLLTTVHHNTWGDRCLLWFTDSASVTSLLLLLLCAQLLSSFNINSCFNIDFSGLLGGFVDWAAGVGLASSPCILTFLPPHIIGGRQLRGCTILGRNIHLFQVQQFGCNYYYNSGIQPGRIFTAPAPYWVQTSILLL